MTAQPRIDLTPLFSPRSIALVGATTDMSKVSVRPLQLSSHYGYAGRVYAVNPKYDRIGDVPCHPSVLDLPEPVDLALVTVRASSVLDVVRQCIERGVRAVCVNSSGFAEVGEVELQAELARTAREAGLALAGPNSMGFVNFRGPVPGLWAVALDPGLPLVPGSVGFVSQSGALSSFILATAVSLGIGMTVFVTTGNEAVLGSTDYVDDLIDDPDTRVICSYMEGVGDGRRFLATAGRALAGRKPLVVLKTGRTRAGSRATASHTASLAGSHAVFSAACRQAGITQVEGVSELLDTTVLLGDDRLPAGNRLAIVTGSGGGAALLADQGELRGLEFPDFTEETAAALRAALPPFATISNPLDGTSAIFREQDAMGTCLRLVIADPSVDLVLAYLGTGYATANAYVRDLLDVRATSAKPLVVVWAAGPADAIARLRDGGIYVFSDELRAIRAVQALVQYGAALTEQRVQAVRRLGNALIDRAPKALPGDPGQRSLPELEARRLLAEAGTPIARHALAASAVEAASLAEQIGFPVAMKVASMDLPHKTEAGAVRLGIRSCEEAARTYGELLEAVRAYAPAARVDGVLVEEMVAGGIEAIVGAVDDPQFGPTVLFGLGGVFAEVLADTAIRIAPIDHTEALAMVREVRAFPLLDGARGRPKADLDALADTIVRVSDLAVEYAGDLAELDINPLMVLPRGQGVRAVDVLITRKG
ncbi:MAG: acetate--CoA ligase family protein [Chloroflexi bacterium]|nr:acetate--CoA ligase family protein [Chloroflexota bacterium]